MSFDGKACIDLLLDREAPFVDRAAAAESLMHYSEKSACDALWRVLADESEQFELREESAGSLGTLWVELGVEYDRLVQIPSALLAETLADFELEGVSIDWAQVGNHRSRIEAALRKETGSD